jgi:hypothetical protein
MTDGQVKVDPQDHVVEWNCKRAPVDKKAEPVTLFRVTLIHKSI